MTSERMTGAGARRPFAAFTLVELVVSISVLTLLVLFVTQLTNQATTITRTGSKHIDTDTQARAVLDRIGSDLGGMIKRLDLDYYLKQPTGYTGHGNGHGFGRRLQAGQLGSDQFAFFSQVPGYYPSGAQSPISLVAYRVNADSSQPSYLRLERMGKGLLWNGVSNSGNLNSRNTVLPIVFLPQTIAGMNVPWYTAVNNDTSVKSEDVDYETVGPQVFRFEYWYLLKNGKLTDVPWDVDARPAQTSIALPTSIGLVDVQAIGVAIAIIDPASRSLVSDPTLFDIASDLDDFRTAPGRGLGGAKKFGDIEGQWNTVLQTVISTGETSNRSKVPAPAASAIRVYSRYFDLRLQ